MSDTVSGAVIVSSLGNDSLTFLSLADATDVPMPGAAHVPGGAHLEQSSIGLMVDFRTLPPDLDVVAPHASPFDQPASVSGYVALLPDETPPVVAGALHLT